MKTKDSRSAVDGFTVEMVNSKGFVIGHDSNVENVTFNEAQSASEILAEEFQYHCDNAMDAFSRSSYGEAVRLFERAAERSPLPPRVRYYFALAVLGKKRPKKLTKPHFNLIEENLNMAVTGFPVPGHVYLLLAYVKFDFCVSNGIRVPSPSVASLLELAQRSGMDPNAVEELQAHTRIREFLTKLQRA